MMLLSIQDKIADGKIFQAILDGLTSALPLPLVALLTFGTIGAAYYLLQEKVIIPMIMLILVGGITIARAPPGYLAGILGVVIVSLAGFAYIMLQRVSTS